MSQELTIIQPERSQGLIRQVADTAEIKKAMQEFQQLKGAILSDSDYQPYKQSMKNPSTGKYEQVEKRFIKKSGWKNLAMALGISVEPINAPIRTDLGEGHYAITREVKATAPNGRYAVGEGSCDTQEERFKKYEWVNRERQFVGYETPKYHDISSTAYTRAANRAISDLVGGGEVSADEIDTTDMDRQLENGPAMLSDGYFKRLRAVANAPEFGKEWQHILVDLVIDRVGHYLNQDQATELGKALKDISATIRDTGATQEWIEGQVVGQPTNERTQQAANFFDAPEPEQTSMPALAQSIGPNNALATVKQLNFLRQTATERHISEEQLQAMCWDKYGYGLDSLTKSQATNFIDSVKQPV